MAHATISADGAHLKLDLDWREIDIAKMVPGYSYKARKKEHSVPLTWAAMVQLRGVFGQAFTYGDDVTDWTWSTRNSRVDPATQLRDVLEVQKGRWAGEGPRVRLYPFQDAGVDWMLTAGSGLLGDELGCGKTPQALVFLELMNYLPALIICPNSVKWHWEARTREWTSANPYVVHGGTGKGRKILAEAQFDPRALVIINYESVRSFSRLASYGSVRLKRCKLCDPTFGDDIPPSRCHVHPKELNGWGFKAVIVDEIHRCGEPTSQQTRAVWAVAHDPSVRARWGLTGTPDSMKRLWSIMHTVQPIEYPTRSKWMERYALTAWNAYGGQDVVGIRPDTRDELFRILDPRFRRMIKAVVLPQLPPIVRQVRYTELTPAQRKSYDELENSLFATLPDGDVLISQNRLVSRLRLSQFAAGTVTVEKPNADDIASWQVHVGFPSPKIDELDAVIEELQPHERFTVSCEHVDVARMASERLVDRGIKHVLIAGGVHPSTVQQACDDLNANRIRALVFTHKKGGVGLDMSGAGVQIKLQRSWSLIEEVQSEGRSHRIGSEIHDQVLIIDIVTRDTREEAQVEALHRKFAIMDEITRDRAAAVRKLTTLSPSDAEFTQVIATLDELNARQEELMKIVDVEELLKEEPDE